MIFEESTVLAGDTIGQCISVDAQAISCYQVTQTGSVATSDLDYTTVAGVSYYQDLSAAGTQPADGDDPSTYGVVDDTVDGFSREWSCTVTPATATTGSSTGTTTTTISCAQFQPKAANSTPANYRFSRKSPQDGVSKLWRIKGGVITGFERGAATADANLSYDNTVAWTGAVSGLASAGAALALIALSSF